MLILQVCEFLDCGDGVHRFHAPARALSALPDVTVVDCDLHHHRFVPLAEQVDVLVMAAFNADLLPLFERRRRAGRRTVVEANDYYPDLQPWNPLSMRWLDRSLQDSFFNALALADGVQTSMPALAERWRPFTSSPLAAFANHLEHVPPLRPRPAERPLTVGWGGSPGHFADWWAVAPLLERWLERRPDVHLAVMNNPFAKPFLSLPETRYHYRGFGSLSDWFDFLEGLDIGLAPLLPSAYNRCRSDVKFLEYASRGVAGIYRDLEPYASVEDGRTGLLYRTDDELLAALDRLADDAALRARIREEAHAYVSRERLLGERVGERLEFYRALGAPSTAVDLHGVDMDGRYGQLRPGPDEAVVSAALREPRQHLASLAAVAARRPDYLSALQLLGQAHNDAGDPRAAIPVLERALALDGERARTWGELGRARWKRGDADAALQALDRAVQVNPRYQPAWQYLLQLLVHRGVAAPERVHEMRRALPYSYPLALLALGVQPAEARVAVLREYLEVFRFDPDEHALAAPAFSQAIAALPPADLASPAGRDLLARAVGVFPGSVRLARLRAAVCGDPAEAARARRLAEQAALFAREVPTDDGQIHVWQLAEHVAAQRAREEAASQAPNGAV